MLTIAVPGLLGQSGNVFVQTHSSRSLARYVDAPIQDSCGLGTAVCVALSLARQTPLAPLVALGAGLAVDDRYIVAATPVTLVADRDVVVLAGPVHDLRADEAATLIALLNRHFGEDGVHFSAPRPSAWFAQCDRSFALRTSTIDASLHHPIASFLPTGPDAKIWQRWQVEIQMLFHEHAINEERVARGLPPVSGIWLSGNGRLADIARPALSNVFAPRDECGDLARGLARQAGLSADILPSAFADITIAKRSREAISATSALPGSNNQSVLITMDKMSNEADIRQFDTDWLQPALDKLVSGGLDALQLVADGHGAAVTWRAKRPSALSRMTSRLKSRMLEVPALAEK